MVRISHPGTNRFLIEGRKSRDPVDDLRKSHMDIERSSPRKERALLAPSSADAHIATYHFA